MRSFVGEDGCEISTCNFVTEGLECENSQEMHEVTENLLDNSSDECCDKLCLNASAIFSNS